MALRIRADVDLKQLEKFGFECEEDDGEKYWCKYLSDNQQYSDMMKLNWKRYGYKI
jgi:hypothetical protein